MKNVLRSSFLVLLFLFNTANYCMSCGFPSNEFGKQVESDRGICWLNNGDFRHIIVEADLNNNGIRIYDANTRGLLLEKSEVLESICGISSTPLNNKIIITAYNTPTRKDFDGDHDDRIVILEFDPYSYDLHEISRINHINAKAVITFAFIDKYSQLQVESFYMG